MEEGAARREGRRRGSSTPLFSFTTASNALSTDIPSYSPIEEMWVKGSGER